MSYGHVARPPSAVRTAAIRAAIVAAAAVIAAPAAADEPPAMAVADAVATPTDGYGRPTCVSGVVTWRHQNELVIEDDTAGIWVALGEAQRRRILQTVAADVAAITIGTRLKVCGTIEQGGFKPLLLPTSLQSLGRAALPPARPGHEAEFFRGLADCRRVEVSGAVRSWAEQSNYWVLYVESVGNSFSIEIPKHLLSEAPTAYEGGRVTVRGVAATIFNTRGQILHPSVKVADLGDLTVRHTMDDESDGVPAVALADIARFRSDDDGEDRIRTIGVVTHVSPGKFVCLQDGLYGVIVECPVTPMVTRGDRAEATGRVDRRSAVAGLVDAALRVIDHAAAVAPVDAAPAEIVSINTAAAIRSQRAEPSDYYGVLIRFPARVFGVQQSETGGTLLLDADGCTVVASLNRSTFGHLASLPPSAAVDVAGIALAPDTPASRLNRPSLRDGERYLRLLVRGPEDVVVVRLPSWWTPARLTAVLAVVASLALAALGWVALLRRMIARQSARLESAIRSQTLLHERLRIARDLHDTMEQDLACLMMRLDAEAAITSDGRVAESLHQLRRCLAQVQADTHDFLWDLRDPIRVDGNLMASLASQIVYMRSMTETPISFVTRGELPVSVPGHVQHALLRIAREAVGNAIRHAAAGRIDVVLAGSPSGIVLEIADDGRGFDQVQAAGAEGHYGLVGMRERAERIGATHAIRSGQGGGTRVIIDVSAALLGH